MIPMPSMEMNYLTGTDFKPGLSLNDGDNIFFGSIM